MALHYAAGDVLVQSRAAAQTLIDRLSSSKNPRDRHRTILNSDR